MSPLLKWSVLWLAGITLACGGEAKPVVPDVPPAAAFQSTCADLGCSFTDSSSDPDGRITAYRWSFGDNSADATTRNATHTYAAAGTYTVVLTVTDDEGATASANRVVQVVLPDAPPNAAFASSCIDLTCAFSESSSDPDGTIVSHHWLFGDGTAFDGPSPGHTYASAGVYQVSVTVTDDRGATGRADHEVTVTASPLTLSANDLGFCYAPGQLRLCIVLERHFQVGSTGAPLKWRAVSDQPWIVVSPATGTTPTDVKASIDLTKAPHPLPYGSAIFGSITASATGAVSITRTIRVRLYFYGVPLP